MSKFIGIVSAYAYAVSQGYTGTEEEYAELMASYATVAEEAAESAESAQASATTANSAASTATNKASEAITAAATATTKASEASESAATSTTAKTDAETARDAAAQSASEAAASAESIDPETLEHKAYGAYVVESASGAIASFVDGADSIPMKDVLVHIEPVQAGSGDPSPDNIRPITGWTGAKVTRTGKNLLPNTSVTSTIQGVTYTVNPDGSINANGTGEGWNGLTVSTFSLSAGMYTISTGIVAENYNCYISCHADKIVLFKNGSEIVNTSRGSKDFTLSEDTELTCKMVVRPDTTINNVVCYPMIRLASDVDTTYQPYTGYDTYDIAFPSEAGTVYGGTLDVTRGVLTVTDAQIASYAGEMLPGEWISDRDVYVAGTTPTTGAQVVYKLATPITYTLTPQEITSLLGTNNLWADTGNSDVEYRADTKMYVDNAIANLQALVLENNGGN